MTQEVIMENNCYKSSSSNDWPKPCQNAFIQFMNDSPHLLAKWIKSGKLAPYDLTFAAEIMGSSNDVVLVQQTLIPLLKHSSAFVREGAIMGLQNHLNDDIVALLRKIVSEDCSSGVRLAASDALTEV